MSGINLGKVFFNFDVNTQEGEAKLKGLQNTLKSTGDNMSKIGGTLTKSLTLPLVALGTAAISTFASFEASMSKVQATMGASAADMEKLSAKAREMGATTRFSASEAGEALNFMAMAGWKTEQAIAGLDGVLNLATASGASLATTSDIVTDTLTGMNMSAEETNRLVDVMATTASNANTNVEMMGETFKYSAPVAGALGIKIEELALATGLMANAGIKASMSGTSLRTGLTNLVKPSDQMAAAMQKYGIELVKNADGSSNLTETMKLLRKQLKDVEAQEKASAIAAIFGKNAMSGWMAVVNASEADFEKLETAIENSSGSAEEMAEIMNDNLQGKLLTLKSSFEEFLIVLGEHLVPLFTEVVTALTNATKWFGELDESTQKIIVSTGLFVAAIGPLISIGGKMVTLFGLLTPTVAATGTAVAGTTVATGGLMTVLAPLLPAILGVTAVMGGLLFANEKYIDHLESKAINSIDYYVDKLGDISPKAAEAGNAIATLEANTTDIIADVILGQNLEQRVPEVVALIQETVDKKNEILNKDAEKEIEYYEYMIEIGDSANKEIWEGKKKAAEEGIKARTDGAEKEQEALKAHWDAVLKGEESYTQEDLQLILEANQGKINAEIENNAELQKAIENGDKNVEELRTRARAESISKLVESLIEERAKKLEALELERQDRILAIEADNTLDAQAKEQAIAKTQEYYDLKATTTRDNHEMELAELQNLYGEELNLFSLRNGEMLSAKKQNDAIIMELTALNNQALISGLDLYYERRGNTIVSMTSAEKKQIEESNAAITKNYNDEFAKSGLSLRDFEIKHGSLQSQIDKSESEILNANKYIKSSYEEAFRKSGLSLGEFEKRYGTLDGAIKNNKDFALDANGQLKRSMSDTYNKAIADLKNMGLTYDATTGNITDGSGKIVASNVSATDALEKLTKGDKNLDNLGKAFKNTGTDATTGNAKTGSSADGAKKKVDGLVKSYDTMANKKNISKTITINEVTNKTTNHKTVGNPNPSRMIPKINELDGFLRSQEQITVGSWIGFSGNGASGNQEHLRDIDKLDRYLANSINILSEKIDKFTMNSNNRKIELKVNLDIDNFNNNRDIDIEELTDDIAFNIERKLAFKED